MLEKIIIQTFNSSIFKYGLSDSSTYGKAKKGQITIIGKPDQLIKSDKFVKNIIDVIRNSKLYFKHAVRFYTLPFWIWLKILIISSSVGVL